MAAPVVELLGGSHQSDIALLDEVEELEATALVFLGDGDDQPKVGGDEIVLGPFLGPLAGRDGLEGGADLFPGDLAALGHLLFEPRLDAVDDPVLLLGLDLERPGQLDHPDDEPGPGGPVADERTDLGQPGVQGLDPADGVQDLSLLGVEVVLGEILLGDGEEPEEVLGIVLDRGFERQDLVHDQGGPGQGLEDRPLALLHPAGQGDLLVAGQEQDAAHLPKIDLDQVSGLLDVLGGNEPLAVPLGAVFRSVEADRRGRPLGGGEDLFLLGEEGVRADPRDQAEEVLFLEFVWSGHFELLILLFI